MAMVDLGSTRNIVNKLEEQLRFAQRDILSFWNEERGSFSYLDSSIDKDDHITSTAICAHILETIRLFPEDKREKCRTFLLTSPWVSSGLPENNVYVCGLAITALSTLGITYKEQKIQTGLDSICENVDKHEKCCIPENQPHTFLAYWAARALKAFQLELNERHTKTYHKILESSCHELYRQLTLKDCDDPNFDLYELVYSLATAVLEPDLVEPRVVDYAIKTIFASQDIVSGYWPTGRPIFRVPRGEGVAVYCSSCEVASIILDIPYSSLLSIYGENLGKIHQRLTEARIEQKNIAGWTHDFQRQSQPISWLTSVVYGFLANYLLLNDKSLQESMLQDFGASIQNMPLSSLVVEKSALEVIKNKIIEPFMDVQDVNAGDGPFIILFGPPGSGKTSIVRAMASELEWPFITLDISYFMAEGENRIFSRTDDLFDRMQTLKKAVVLWDEVDELVISRKTEQEKFGRMMTDTMLTKLQYLHDISRFILVLTTNNIRNFDFAAGRPGRFDYIIPVPLPSYDTRRDLLEHDLKEGGIQQEVLHDSNEELGSVSHQMEGFSIPLIRQVISSVCRKTIGECSKAKITEILNEETRLAQSRKIQPDVLQEFQEDLKRYTII